MGSLSGHLVDVYENHGGVIDEPGIPLRHGAGKAVPGIPLAEDFQEFVFFGSVLFRYDARPAEANDALEGGGAVAGAFGRKETLEGIYLETDGLAMR